MKKTKFAVAFLLISVLLLTAVLPFAAMAEEVGAEETVNDFVLSFDSSRFVEALPYVALGMLMIFLVIGIIIVATVALNYFGNKLSKKKNQ